MAEVERFPYIPVRNTHGELALRPMLPLALVREERIINISGILDSGGDVNVLPYNIGTELGLVWEDQRILTGLSGNLSERESRGVVLSATVEQFPPVRLAFAWTRLENIPLILGQVNFFTEFDVCFFRSESAFEVRLKSQG
jgi:hypothetical protein